MPAITKEMGELEEVEVAEITSLLDLAKWPEGSRVLVRREQRHPGTNCNLFDPGGLRHQALITNSHDPEIAGLETRHRLDARVEDRVRWGKALGLENFPSSKAPRTSSG